MQESAKRSLKEDAIAQQTKRPANTEFTFITGAILTACLNVAFHVLAARGQPCPYREKKQIKEPTSLLYYCLLGLIPKINPCLEYNPVQTLHSLLLYY